MQNLFLFFTNIENSFAILTLRLFNIVKRNRKARKYNIAKKFHITDRFSTRD